MINVKLYFERITIVLNEKMFNRTHQICILWNEFEYHYTVGNNMLNICVWNGPSLSVLTLHTDVIFVNYNDTCNTYLHWIRLDSTRARQRAGPCRLPVRTFWRGSDSERWITAEFIGTRLLSDQSWHVRRINGSGR